MSSRHSIPHASAPLNLRIPERIASFGLPLLALTAMNSIEEAKRLTRFIEQEALDELACEVGRDLRQRLQLPKQVMVAVVGKLLPTEMLGYESDESLVDELQRLVERVYIANPTLQGKAQLGLGDEIETVIGPLDADFDEEIFTGMAALALPVFLVGPADVVEMVAAGLFKKEGLELHASDRTYATLARLSGIPVERWVMCTYANEANVDEMADAFRETRDLLALDRAAKAKEFTCLPFGAVQVIAGNGRLAVPFMTVDYMYMGESASRDADEDLEIMWTAWVISFRRLMDKAHEKKLPLDVVQVRAGIPILITDIRSGQTVVSDLLIESSSHSVDDNAAAVTRVMLELCWLEDLGCVFGILSKRDGEARMVSQENLYPITPEGVPKLMEYAEAEAAACGVPLERIMLDEIPYCPEHRTLGASLLNKDDLLDSAPLESVPRTIH